MPPSRPYRVDRESADRFIPEQRRILASIFGAHESLVVESTEDQDREEACDMVILVLNGTKIGVRVRDAAKYIGKYPNDVTFRYSRPSGAVTEYQKILAGHGDFSLYALADFQTAQILTWKLIDLHSFRLKRPNGGTKRNDDGTTFFAFNACQPKRPGLLVRAGVTAAYRPPLFAA